MKYFKYILLIGMINWTLTACNDHDHAENHDHDHDEKVSEVDHHEEAEDVVMMTPQQRDALELKIGTISKKNLSATVKANGVLEVPPQNRAHVSSYFGGNVKEIYVIEGDKVKKGQQLALLEHPDFIQLQMDYQDAWHRMEYLEKEYTRQKRLYEAEVGSGKSFQETEADYFQTRSKVEGLEAKLEMLKLDPGKVRENKIYRYVSVITPIEGYVKFVNIAIGQYVQQDTEMFTIANNHHIHVDLMVFEKDVWKVKKGQKVNFTVANRGGAEMEAVIYAVGKTFEEQPKAVHVHAEIESTEEWLIPGMYVQGRIQVENYETTALPEAAVFSEGEKSYIFVKTAEEESHAHHDEGEEHAHEEENGHEDENTFVFKAVEVVTGERDQGWVEIKLMQEIPPDAKVAINSAYYLMAEMKKGEGGHHH